MSTIRRIQAFVLDYSQDLLLLQYVYDFHIDGRLLIRRNDITSIRCGATDIFQKGLLDTEGLLESIRFTPTQPIQSYDSFLRSLAQNQIVIVEDETQGEFLIGTVLEADRDLARIRCFTGAANWKEAPSEIAISQITSCQIETNYIDFYARHFERTRACG